MNNSKQYDISKRILYQAYRLEKRNKSSAGVDGIDFEEYEKNLKSKTENPF